MSEHGLRAYSSWKQFAQTVAKAAIQVQARLIKEEGQHLTGPDDDKVTAPSVEVHHGN
jgi:hypothetical protein